MSIAIQSGKVWDTNEAITADKLNNMLDEATTFGLVTADMASGYTLADVATSEPTPTLGATWIDATGQLRFGDGTAFQYGSGILRLTNKSGAGLVLGDVVRLGVVDADSVTTIAPGTDEPATVFGVVQETIANNAAGFVMYRGITQVNINSLTTSPSDVGITFRNGYGICVEPSTPVKTAAALSKSIEPTQLMSFFGYLLENPAGAFVPGLYYCKIWR